MHLLSILLLLSGALTYTQEQNEGLWSKTGKALIPGKVQSWWQQRQEEQAQASKVQEQRKNIKQLFSGSSNLGDEGRAQLLQSLLSQGMDPNSKTIDYWGRDDSSTNLLMAAAINGMENLVDMLLKAGARPNDQSSHFGETALYGTIEHANDKHPTETANIIKKLLEAGADPNIPVRNGETPLHRAVASLRPDLVKLLLDHGANPTTARGGWDKEHRFVEGGGGTSIDAATSHIEAAQKKINDAQEELKTTITIKELLEQKK